MSPQSSWDSSLPSLHLDPKSSYFPTPASMPLYYAPHPLSSSPGSSYPTTPTSDPQSRGSPSESGGYFHHSNASLGSSSPKFGRSEQQHQEKPPVQHEPRQPIPSRGSFTKDLIARSAASIPPPPPLTHQSRTCGGPISSFMLNSTNTVVYSSTALRNKAAGFSVGLVSLSPLDATTCCGGGGRCFGDCARSTNGVTSSSCR